MFKSLRGFIDPTLLLALAGLITAIIGTTVATNINQQNSELRSQASVKCTELSVKNCGGCSTAGYKCKVINNTCRTSETKCSTSSTSPTTPSAGGGNLWGTGTCSSFRSCNGRTIAPNTTSEYIDGTCLSATCQGKNRKTYTDATGTGYCWETLTPCNNCSSNTCSTSQPTSPTVSPTKPPYNSGREEPTSRPSSIPTNTPIVTVRPTSTIRPTATPTTCITIDKFCGHNTTGCCGNTSCIGGLCKLPTSATVPPTPTPDTSCLSLPEHECISTAWTCVSGTRKPSLSCGWDGFICMQNPNCFDPATASRPTIAPYCAYQLLTSCLNGCTPDSSGGKCNPPRSTPILSPSPVRSATVYPTLAPYCAYQLLTSCLNGCTPDSSGGKCNPPPPTPQPTSACRFSLLGICLGNWPAAPSPTPTTSNTTIPDITGTSCSQDYTKVCDTSGNCQSCYPGICFQRNRFSRASCVSSTNPLPTPTETPRPITTPTLTQPPRYTFKDCESDPKFICVSSNYTCPSDNTPVPNHGWSVAGRMCPKPNYTCIYKENWTECTNISPTLTQPPRPSPTQPPVPNYDVSCGNINENNFGGDDYPNLATSKCRGYVSSSDQEIEGVRKKCANNRFCCLEANTILTDIGDQCCRLEDIVRIDVGGQCKTVCKDFDTSNYEPCSDGANATETTPNPPTTQPEARTQQASTTYNTNLNTTNQTIPKVAGEFCGLSCNTTCISGRGTILGNLFCAPSTCDPLQPFMCQANTLYHCNFIPKTEKFDWVRQRPCTQGCDSNGNRCLDDESSPTLIPSSKSL